MLQLSRSIIILFSIYAYEIFANPAFLDSNSEKIKDIESKITKLEQEYSKFHIRESKKISLYTIPTLYESSAISYPCCKTDTEIKKNYTLNRIMFAEKCVISSASEVFDEGKRLVNFEEGPVDLTKVETVSPVLFDDTNSIVFEIEFIADKKHFPKLFFHNHEQREKALSLINSLIPLCKERDNLHKEISSKQAVLVEESKFPESSALGAREVRSFDDDPTMRAALLSEGLDAFSSRLKIAEEAQGPGDSIAVQYLLFTADEGGKRLANTLVSRAQKGVKVEVLIDALSPFLDVRDLTVRKNTKIMYRNLMAAGIPVYGFRCSSHHLLDELTLGARISKLLLNQRPHEKFWIVNHNKAILGGMNIGNEYLGLNEEGPKFWRDQDLILEGNQIVRDLSLIFEGNVKTFTANYLDPRKDKCFNPFDPLKEEEKYEKFYHSHVEEYKKKEECIYDGECSYQTKAQKLIRKIDHKSQDVSLELSFEDLKFARIVHSRPKLKELHIEQMYLDLFNGAQSEILIENAYFIPSLAIKSALIKAAKRGVVIKIITNSAETNDIPPVAALARYHYKDLVDPTFRGSCEGENCQQIEIYEWTGQNKLGDQERGMNHAKFVVVDRKFVFIGSYNFDPRSRNLNSEDGVVFQGQENKLAIELATDFYKKDLAYSRRMTYRHMVSYRKPISFIRASILQSKGYQFQNGLKGMMKDHFFYKIAFLDEDIW